MKMEIYEKKMKKLKLKLIKMKKLKLKLKKNEKIEKIEIEKNMNDNK